MNTVAICAVVVLFGFWLAYVTALDRIISWVLRRLR